MQLVTINKSIFRLPRHLLPSAWTGHLPFAGWIMEEHVPDVFVELGTHHGASYFGFCQSAQENAARTKCFAVDTWEGDEHTGFYGSEVYEKVVQINHDHYAGFSQILRMKFDDAADYFTDGTIDLLHIDGLHTYEAVIHDYEVWLPKMSKRGVILFHDTAVRERQFGVWKLWAELSEKFPSFEFQHAHGLGVLLVGDCYGDGLSRLADMPEEQATLFRALFEALANRVESSSAQEQLRTAREELAWLQSQRQEEQTKLQDAYFRLGEADAFARTQIAYADQLVGELQNARENTHGQSPASGHEVVAAHMGEVERVGSTLLTAIESLSGAQCAYADRLASELQAAQDLNHTKYVEAMAARMSGVERIAASLLTAVEDLSKMPADLLEIRTKWREVAENLGSQQQLITGIHQNMCSENERVERVSQELVNLMDVMKLRTLLEEREHSLYVRDKELADLHSKAQELMDEMAEIKSSPSWRWASILRRFSAHK